MSEQEKQEKSKKYRLSPKFHWGGVEWGTNDFCYPQRFYYFYWFYWNEKKYRGWGRDKIWHDGPHRMVNLWFFSISWSLPWFMGRSDDYFL